MKMKSIPITVVILQILLSTVNADQNLTRYISLQDLEGVKKFQSNNVTTYSQLLFDVEREQVIVGARDNLYRLRLKSLELLENVPWLATNVQVKSCANNTSSDLVHRRLWRNSREPCHNYITVLLKNRTEVFACGTSAVDPSCTRREIKNLSNVIEELSGARKYPSEPPHTVTSLLANGGSELFIGFEIFEAAGGMISKYSGTSEVHTILNDNRWVNEPRFAGSFETETHVYFLFREYVDAFTSHDVKTIQSRIARVCKNDSGLEGSTWETFLKTRLSCRTPGDIMFHYDVIESVAYNSEKRTFYATFTTSGVPGSAVCAFHLEDVEKIFSGPFQNPKNMKLEETIQDHAGQTCRSSNVSLTQQYKMMYEPVRNKPSRPVYWAHLERFTQIAVDVTSTTAYCNSRMTVLYVATSTGFIKKISISSRYKNSCVIEVWGPLPIPVLTLQFLNHTRRLYVGTGSGLFSIPVAQCQRYTSGQACLDARDPYCGWHENERKCTQQPEAGSSLQHWHQELDGSCPFPVDPGQFYCTDNWELRWRLLGVYAQGPYGRPSSRRFGLNPGSSNMSHAVGPYIEFSTIVASLFVGFLIGITITACVGWFYSMKMKSLSSTASPKNQEPVPGVTIPKNVSAIQKGGIS